MLPKTTAARTAGIVIRNCILTDVTWLYRGRRKKRRLQRRPAISSGHKSLKWEKERQAGGFAGWWEYGVGARGGGGLLRGRTAEVAQTA